MKPHLMVVDDDRSDVRSLPAILADAGYFVSVAHDPRDLPHVLQRHAIHLILLAVALPHIDGYSLCAQLKERYSDIPIILLGTCAGDTDFAKAFGQGADDVVILSHEPVELLARIQAVLHRYQRAECNPAAVQMTVGNTSLDRGGSSFATASEHAVVTPMEKKILDCLMRNAHYMLSRRKVIEEREGNAPQSNRVDVYIRGLCHKIEARPNDRHTIHTVGDAGNITEEDKPERECPA